MTETTVPRDPHISDIVIYHGAKWRVTGTYDGVYELINVHTGRQVCGVWGRNIRSA
ncbi:MAG TPA: hypothetical protein VGH72_33860 [Pseudonocardia sp.]|jgi:hypothetical protein